MEDINKDIHLTTLKLNNMAQGDNTMTIGSAISMKDDNLSQRSGSSDGNSSNKRMMKSNIALQNKQL